MIGLTWCPFDWAIAFYFGRKISPLLPQFFRNDIAAILEKVVSTLFSKVDDSSCKGDYENFLFVSASLHFWAPLNLAE